MICPNCKTELVEVNGRYICSDCGREIPENEVMASDWGNGGAARAGLFGAGTDEPDDVNKPVAEYNTSLSESESEEVASQATSAEPSSAETLDEPTVEEVLQQQSTESKTVDQSTGEPKSDTGFYTAENSQQPAINNQQKAEAIPVIPDSTPVIPSETEETTPVIPAQELESSPGSFVPTQDDNVVLPAVDPVEPVAEEIPITVPPVDTVAPAIPTPSPVIPAEAGIQVTAVSPEAVPEPIPVLETIPEHSEVVKDMFADTAIATAPVNPDPGIYTDPMYGDVQGTEQPESSASSTQVPMPADRRANLIVLIGGSVLVLLTIVGGIWGYVALSKKANVAEPVVTNQEVAWQELQVVDGGFKVSYPGQPEKADVTQPVNGADTTLASYTYTSDDITYSVSYVALDATSAKAINDNLATTLPTLVGEVATAQGLTLGETKIGKYYTANAIDFTLTSDTASYQGKLMINGSKYILVIAGSSSGQTVDYTKFIKSFSFITTGSTN